MKVVFVVLFPLHVCHVKHNVEINLMKIEIDLYKTPVFIGGILCLCLCSSKIEND